MLEFYISHILKYIAIVKIATTNHEHVAVINFSN